jgi:hypothetical protein
VSSATAGEVVVVSRASPRGVQAVTARSLAQQCRVCA